jgi:heme-degrading monooxygenase HmoA
MEQIATTPEPPYLAVIFTAIRNGEDAQGYADAAQRMLELASRQPGFLGVETARDGDGFGITVSYWRDEASIKNWKNDVEHLKIQARGRDVWYAQYHTRVCRVDRDYGFSRDGD